MKKLVALLALATLSACASKPPETSTVQQQEAGKLEDWISLRSRVRTPTAVDDDAYRAYKTFVFDTTVARAEAFNKGDFEKVCNSIGNGRGNDTYAYYLSFEQLRFDNDISRRLKKEVGPFVYRNLVEMDKRKLPYKLHDACVSHNRRAIETAMRASIDVYSME